MSSAAMETSAAAARSSEGGVGVASMMIAAMEGSTASLSCTDEDGAFDKQRISLNDLKQLKAVFDSAVEAGGSGELDEDQFLSAFSPILGAAMTEEQLRLWFMRVDASANGAVDWDEFSSFLLYSVDKGQTVVTSSGVSIDEVSFVKDPRTAIGNSTEASATRISGYNHSDAMTKVLIHPRGKIFTSAQDGTIRIWDGTTMDFEGMLHHGKGWVTDMAFARDYAKIVCTTVDRLVLVYDVHTEKLSRGFAGTIDVAAIAQSAQPSAHVEVPWFRPYRRDEIDRRHGGLFAGATGKESLQEYRQRHERRREGRKSATMMRMTMLSKMEVPALTLAIIPASATVEGTEQVVVGLTDGSIIAYAVFGALGVNEKVEPTMCFPELHSHAFVTCIKWVPSMSSLITTGSDGWIHVISPSKKTATRVCERHADEHPIHSCEWIASERLLATCGNDRHVSLWSLNSRGPPIPLKGHLAHVSHLHYREEDNLLFTMDVDKCIKVWDVRTLRPIQSMVDYDTYKPLDKQTVLTYDAKRHCLVTGIVAPVLWSMGRLLVPYPDPAYSGHQKAITAVLFSKVFHQIVTADTDQIKTWSLETGELMSTATIDSLRSTAVRSSVPTEAYGAIHAVAFDGPGRRLIIGVTGGRVLVTNFANGQLLQELVPQMPHRDRREFSASECSAMSYFSTGAKCFVGCIRGSDLLVWEDVAEGTLEKRLDRIVSLSITKRTFAHFAVIQPSADVMSGQIRWRSPSPLCMCAMPPGYVAIGTDCGLVVVYSSVSLDVLSVFGVYDLNINISALHYDEKREILFAAKSDATVDVLSQGMKDTRFTICLRDPRTGRAATATCIDLHEDTGLLVLGTDEGYALLFDTSAFSMADVPASVVNSATLYHPNFGCNFIGGFQAHKDDICRLQVFSERDLRLSKKGSNNNNNNNTDQGTSRAGTAATTSGMVGAGDEEDFNATHRSLGVTSMTSASRPITALGAATMYVITGGSDCQTRLWTTTDQIFTDRPAASASQLLAPADDGAQPPVIVTPAGAVHQSEPGAPPSGAATNAPASPNLNAEEEEAAVNDTSFTGDQTIPFASGPPDEAARSDGGESDDGADSEAPEVTDHGPLTAVAPTWQTLQPAAGDGLPPLPFYDARFIGYCGFAQGWKLAETRDRIAALTSIPAPLVHETCNYFEVARYVRDPPSWKPVPNKASIVDAHIERSLLAMDEPQTEATRLRKEALDEKRARMERVIAAPNLYVQARDRDKALLLQSDLTPSSVTVNRHAAPSAAPASGRGGGSPTNTSSSRATGAAVSRIGVQPSAADGVPAAVAGVGALAGASSSARSHVSPTRRGGGLGAAGADGTANVPRPHSPTNRNKSRLEAAAAAGLLNRTAVARSKRKKSMVALQGLMNGSLLFGGDESSSKAGSPRAAGDPCCSSASPRSARKNQNNFESAEFHDAASSPTAAAVPTQGNQTPTLPDIGGGSASAAAAAKAASAQNTAASSSSVPTLPKIDLGRAHQLQRGTVVAAAAPKPSPHDEANANAAEHGAEFLLAFPTPHPPAAGAPSAGGRSSTNGDSALTAGGHHRAGGSREPRGRSPSRDVLVNMSRMAQQQDREDKLVAEGARNDPELDDDARLLALERRLPISARIDQWRRTQQTKPQKTAGQAWTARPHGQLGLSNMDRDIVASATSGRRRQMMLLDIDQRIARRRGLNM